MQQATFKQSLIAISALLIPVLYGLIARPLWLEQTALPLELVFISASIMAIVHLFCLGYCWTDIQKAIADKLAQAIPTLLLLFAIGLLIASWLVSGTIPMLVYYMLTMVSAEHMYLLSFLVPIVFSICTGTSWGSIATIGLVLITVAQVIGAQPGIVTGAIVAGAYFGDKLSPLSDTTNIAAIAVDVSVYQHIQSMLITTLPSALLAAIGYMLVDTFMPISDSNISSVALLEQTLTSIEQVFQFHIFLLVPPLIVILSAWRRLPALPTLIISSLTATLLAFGVQGVSPDSIITTLHRGFNIEQFSTIYATVPLPEQVATLFNRGGLYALSEPIVITILVFIYVGTLSCTNAIPVFIHQSLASIKKRSMLIWASLTASALTNAMTSSQYANSFIVGEAFVSQYDQKGIPRKVLSRSLEDTGTLIESLIPWSTTAVFIYTSLGVSIAEYWHWQLLSLINIPIAFLFALFGVGCFYARSSNHTGQKV